MEPYLLFSDDIPTQNCGDQIRLSIKPPPAIHSASLILDHLLNLQLPALLQSVLALARMEVKARRVDGRIIGTGEADFTKGNSLYTLNYKGKVFQLVDVPGIEGDESKYIGMVCEAVAKAHLVFYVNGTNKKPEKATAEKIRSYLRRGTQVCPIINVRGSADAYEFEEDRKSLECHGGASTALAQTKGVLELVLDKEVLLPGLCIQGLLAFSSLAINSGKNVHTSIHPSRDKDLVIHQNNYMKHFASAKAMFEFSQARAVAQVLHAKLDTFRDDIIESNKGKVRELLVENIGILETALKEHQTFINRVKPEFEKCRESIKGSVQSFERVITAGRKNLWSTFFNNISEHADKVVAEYFGDSEKITKELEKTFQIRHDKIKERLKEQLEEQLEILQNNMCLAIERLIQDVQRVDFLQGIAFNDDNKQATYHTAQLDMKLGLKDWGSIAFDVGTYAASGAGIGSPWGPPGIAIGALVGLVIGILVSATQIFIGKEKRIRKAQAQVQEKLNEIRSQIIGSQSDDTKYLVKSIRKDVDETVLSQVDTIYTRLARPLDIIQKQIALMNHIKENLENMPHGTIQAIQR